MCKSDANWVKLIISGRKIRGGPVCGRIDESGGYPFCQCFS